MAFLLLGTSENFGILAGRGSLCPVLIYSMCYVLYVLCKQVVTLFFPHQLESKTLSERWRRQTLRLGQVDLTISLKYSPHPLEPPSSSVQQLPLFGVPIEKVAQWVPSMFFFHILQKTCIFLLKSPKPRKPKDVYKVFFLKPGSEEWCDRKQRKSETVWSNGWREYFERVGSSVRQEGVLVPHVVRCCVEEVERRGMQEVGIYRISGTSSDVNFLKAAFNSSKETRTVI